MSGKPNDKLMKTIIGKYGLTEDGRSKHHVTIGADGGSAPYVGKKGFAADPELARLAGRKGGAKSKRTK
jgi:general stress protein YciG